MNTVERTTASVRTNVRSLAREPFTLALLLLMPVASIQLYGLSVGAIADFGRFDTAVSLLSLGKVTGAVFATGALAGVLGLFQSLGVRTADGRLVVSGYRRLELAAARLTTVAVTALVVAVVATISLAWSIEGHPVSPAITVVGLSVAGVLYGLLGVVVGTVLPRPLEGSLVLVALADVSAIVASGLFPIGDRLTGLSPLAHPHGIALRGVADGSNATAHALPAVGYLLVALLLAVVALVRALPAGGDAA